MNDHRTTTLDKTTRLGLIALAVIQGLALLILHLAIEHEHWLAADPRWLKALYTVALALPAFYLLGMVQLRDRLNALALLLAPLLFWMGWHLGWAEQALEPWEQHSFTFSFGAALAVALFILALFFRSSAACKGWPTRYLPLLSLAWELALTLLLLGLFMGVFWSLLWLGAALFAAIGLSVFDTLFGKPAFVYPVTGLVVGLALVMIRSRYRLIQSVRQMGEALIKALLPLVALIIVLFFAVLPFTGLQPVWDTGRASSILMTLMLTLLLFFNVVFHEPHAPAPYPAWLGRLILLAVALLPVGSVLAAWALWLRIDQYGLSLDRLWAALLQALTAAFTLSYSLLLLWRRGSALQSLQRANILLALLVAGALMLVNTPLVDMRHWVAQHQIKRLMEGRTAVDTFDVNYLRFQLGQPGVLALQALEDSEFAEAHPALSRRITLSLRQAERWSPEPLVDADDLGEVAQQFNVRSENAVLPEALLTLLAGQTSTCLSQVEPCQAVQPSGEAAFQWLIYEPYNTAGQAYAVLEGDWQHIGTLSPLGGTQAQHDLACQTVQLPEDLQRLPEVVNVYQGGNCLYSLQPTLESVRQRLSIRK
ncbi:uncharacterized protein DUF4153 [Vreelandella songnenensis]|uniref:Uncharacterized protein DUF4153 n=1 Tax=Vreelandella songnenensis TaxID=1176243 RepID=A0A2T0UZT7_9GAMM|nr:DUF4153 domain-containing protein [Halomonas songnenensis]PRY63414.1 uncharacterized protein DUF4153 [Halomonas songnenensis]